MSARAEGKHGGAPLAAATAAAAALVVLIASFRINEYDFWQHLLVGKVVWETRSVPTTQIWTWPTYGAPDVNSSWGFEALLYPFFAAGQVLGLFVWRWWTALAAFGLALMAGRRLGANGLVAVAFAMLAAIAARPRMQPRPETLAAILLASFVWILERRRQGGGDATAWLPALSWVWANTHISWFLGPCLVGAHALEATWRARRDSAARRLRLWAVLAACVAVSFANPFGWRALWQPFQFYFEGRHRLIYRSIDELLPVNLAESAQELVPVALFAWPLLYLWRWLRGRRDLLEGLLLVAFSALAWSNRRFVGYYAVAMAPYAARAASEALATLAPRAAATIAGWRGAAATAGLCALMSVPTLAQRDPALGIGITPRAQFPGVADYIERHGVHGRMFNHFHMGGYLLWRFWPDRLPFMDIHQAGTVEDQNAYVLALARKDWWRRLDERYRFEVVALDRHSVADSLMRFLERDTAWALVFLDDGAALYLRHAPRTDSLIAATGYVLVAASKPGAGLVAARAEADTGLRRCLVAELERMARSSQDNASAYSMLANMAMLDGRWELARDHLERGRRVDPALPRYHERVGLLALVQGDARRALEAFRRELREHPGLADLEARVGEAHLALGDTALARRQFLKELGLHPANRLARARLEAIGER